MIKIRMDKSSSISEKAFEKKNEALNDAIQDFLEALLNYNPSDEDEEDKKVYTEKNMADEWLSGFKEGYRKARQEIIHDGVKY